MSKPFKSKKMATPLYHQIMDTPDVKLLLDQVQASLAEEAEQRKAFYEWLSPDIKAEFINGEIILHSPAKERHLMATESLFKLLSTFVDKHDFGKVHIEKAMVSLTRNDYEPDICFWTKEKSADFHDDLMLHPAPDLIVEVLSKSTAGRDRGVKYNDYASHGVEEYWIVDANKQTVEVFLLDEETMQYKATSTPGIKDQLKSKAISGFRIPVLAIFDKKTNLATLKMIVDGA